MKKVLNKIAAGWSYLPKPVKVAIYMAVGQLLAQVSQDLTKFNEATSVYFGIIINFALVLLAYGKDEVAKRL